MLVKGRRRFGGTFLSIFFHLSKTSVQKGLLTPNVCLSGEVWGGSAKKKIVSSRFGIRRNLHMSFERCVLFSQEHCSDAQCMVSGGTPRPPQATGVNIIFLESLCLLPFMKLTIILSI